MAEPSGDHAGEISFPLPLVNLFMVLPCGVITIILGKPLTLIDNAMELPSGEYLGEALRLDCVDTGRTLKSEKSSIHTSGFPFMYEVKIKFLPFGAQSGDRLRLRVLV